MNKVSHLGIIPDGGRRWSRLKDVSLLESYKRSMDKLGEYLEAFYKWGIPLVSVYMLSKPNLSREAYELTPVIEAECSFLDKIVPALARGWNLSVRVAGKLDYIPDSLRTAAAKVTKEQSDTERKLYLCIAYDPFDELFEAIRTGVTWHSKEQLIQNLWVSDGIDLVIRTGGGVTLSQFLPLQCSYARLIFLKELFNDTTVDDFIRIIEDHEHLNLLFGT